MAELEAVISSAYTGQETAGRPVQLRTQAFYTGRANVQQPHCVGQTEARVSQNPELF